MARTEGEKISRQKYERKAYDQILLKVRKGKREEYKQTAERLGLGQMEMIRLATETFIAAHNGEEFKPTTPAPMTADERKLLDEFNALPDDTRKALLKLIKTINQAQAKH